MVLLTQGCGQPTVLRYFSHVFSAVGMAQWTMPLVSICKFGAAIAAAVLADKIGRKQLLYYGNGVMLFSMGLGILGIFLEQPLAHTIIVSLFMVLYVSGFQFSFGPML